MYCPRKNKMCGSWQKGFDIHKKVNEDSYMVKNGSQMVRANKKHVKKDFSLKREVSAIPPKIRRYQFPRKIRIYRIEL